MHDITNWSLGQQIVKYIEPFFLKGFQNLEDPNKRIQASKEMEGFNGSVAVFTGHWRS